MRRIQEDSHVIQVGNLALFVGNNWEGKVCARDLINILDPPSVAFNSIGRETDQLSTTLGELRLQLRECAQLGCANRCVILGVREQHNPVVSNELVEIDWAIGRLGIKVWRNGAQTEAIKLRISKNIG